MEAPCCCCLSESCELIDFPPTFQQGSLHMVGARLGPVVRMSKVIHDLRSVASVGRGEWLIPGAENVTVRIR